MRGRWRRDDVRIWRALVAAAVLFDTSEGLRAMTLICRPSCEVHSETGRRSGRDVRFRRWRGVQQGFEGQWVGARRDWFSVGLGGTPFLLVARRDPAASIPRLDPCIDASLRPASLSSFRQAPRDASQHWHVHWPTAEERVRASPLSRWRQS